MKKTLIFYKPEYADLAIKLRDNYRAHDHEEADIVSVEEHDDIEYAEKMQYDEAVFIEDGDTVIFHDIESGYTNRLPVTDVFYNNLSEYDGKYVRIRDTDGNDFSGRARYGNASFLECEWGMDEDGIFIEDVLICNSQIESIEEIVPHGTAELRTEHLVLRRYRPEDAEQLHQQLGKDPEMHKYSGWNPYETPEMAQDTLWHFIDSYNSEHSYSWVMDVNGDDVVAGTIGAYDYNNGQIEVGFSVGRVWQGRGFATEALKTVLSYLTKNEGIACVTAWCAAENTGSRKVLEKAGMQLVNTEKDGLIVDGKVYDKMIYEYRHS